MKALCVISGILLILFLLLILPVTVIADFTENKSITVKYLFLKFRFGLNGKKKDKPKKEKKKQKPKPDSDKKKSSPKNNRKRKIAETVSEYAELLRELLKNFSYMLKHITVGRFYVKISVCGEDAADTAVQYGAVCAVIYPFAAFTESIITVKNMELNVEPNFGNVESFGEAFISFRIKPFHVVLAAISAVKCFVKFKNSK